MFSWDARKALKNSAKHGVPFEEASTIFSDPDGLDWEDLEHVHIEPPLEKTWVFERGPSPAGGLHITEVKEWH